MLKVAALAVVPPKRGHLLDEIGRRACLYFAEQADPGTGLVRDRARIAGPEHRRVASIAATGFGLSAMAIADARRYLPRGEPRARVLQILRYLVGRAIHKSGFFYHFSDMRTGERVWGSEFSSVDTAWVLCGAMHCAGHFDDPEVRRLAEELNDRVDWRWMLDGGQTLSHGWMPEIGFLPYRWDCYSELMAMYLMAMGSATSPVPAACWNAFRRPRKVLGGLEFIDAGTPLFTHQYSHAWVDFRGRRDAYADYFENSRRATLAHRQVCLALPCYSENIWGFTAADTSAGYLPSPPQGTVVPCAAGGSVAFLPRECGAALQAMLDRYPNAWGRYGFADAFDPRSGWYSPDVIGIDLGIMLLMAENARRGGVWEACAHNPVLRRGLAAAGLTSA